MKIKILPLILFLVVLVGLLRLGFWQLGRADEKRQLLAEQQQTLQQAEIDLVTLLATTKQSRYQRVKLVGKYLPEQQFLIDNQIYKGKVGYFVMTPFVLAANQQLVLVNRGWVKATGSRDILPSIDFKPPAELSITGITNHFPSVGWVLEGADKPSDGWPSVVQIITAEQIAKKLQQPIINFQVQLLAEQDNGYIRDWQIHAKLPPEKHTAYAFQWFSLAATLTILIFWISFKTKKYE